MVTETEYARRLKAQFKRRLEEVDSQLRTIDYELAMPVLSTSQSSKNRREHLRRGRKQLVHRKKQLLADIRQAWKEYKGRK